MQQMQLKTVYTAQNGRRMVIYHPPLPCIGRIEVKHEGSDVFVRVTEDPEARCHVFIMEGIGIWSGVRFLSPKRTGEEIVFFSCQINQPRAAAVICAGEGAVIWTAGYNGKFPRRYKIGAGSALEQVDPFYEVNFTASDAPPVPTPRTAKEVAQQRARIALFDALAAAREQLVKLLNSSDHEALRVDVNLGGICASLEALTRYVRRLTRMAEVGVREAGLEKALSDAELDAPSVNKLLGRAIKFDDDAPAAEPTPEATPMPEPEAALKPTIEATPPMPKPEPAPAPEPKATFEPFVARVVQGERGLVARAENGKDYFLPQKARQALRASDVIRVTAVTPAQRAGWLDGVKSYQKLDTPPAPPEPEPTPAEPPVPESPAPESLAHEPESTPAPEPPASLKFYKARGFFQCDIWHDVRTEQICVKDDNGKSIFLPADRAVRWYGATKDWAKQNLNLLPDPFESGAVEVAFSFECASSISVVPVKVTSIHREGYGFGIAYFGVSSHRPFEAWISPSVIEDTQAQSGDLIYATAMRSPKLYKEQKGYKPKVTGACTMDALRMDYSFETHARGAEFESEFVIGEVDSSYELVAVAVHSPDAPLLISGRPALCKVYSTKKQGGVFQGLAKRAFSFEIMSVDATAEA